MFLSWNMSMDLSPYKFISLREIQIGPLSVRRHDYLLEIHSNIIARTLYNPLRELASVRVSRNSSFVDSTVSPGMFRKHDSYITHTFVCFRLFVLETFIAFYDIKLENPDMIQFSVHNIEAHDPSKVRVSIVLYVTNEEI